MKVDFTARVARWPESAMSGTVTLGAGSELVPIASVG